MTDRNPLPRKAAHPFVHGIRPGIARRLLAALLLLPTCTGAAQAGGRPPGCPEGSGDCGLAESGLTPYNAILIGQPLGTLDDDEMRALYRWAKTRMWKDFPDDEADYLERNRVLLMPTGAPGQYVFVHFARLDHEPRFHTPASLLRYTPRALPDSFYPDGRPIHSALAGCVAVLCVAGDVPCFGDYLRGRFRFNDGLELDPLAGTPLPNGRRIDPVSLRERGQHMREQFRRNPPPPNPRTPRPEKDSTMPHASRARRPVLAALVGGLLLFPLPTLAAAASPPSEHAAAASAFDDFARLDTPHTIEPLLSAGSTPEETAALADALERWGRRVSPLDRGALQAFLAAHPNSPWKAALLGNLGLSALEEGRYTQALADFEAAWQAGKDIAQPRVRAFVERIGGELVKLHTQLGHARAVALYLPEMSSRLRAGAAAEALHFARAGLARLQNPDSGTFLCGPLALEQLRAQPRPLARLPVAAGKHTGYSLEELETLARAQGQDLRALHRGTGVIPVPSVAHWKSGHYVAILSTGRGAEGAPARYLVRDAARGREYWMSREAVLEESSGYFLAAGQALGWRAAHAGERRRIVGAGYPTSQDTGCTEACPAGTGMIRTDVQAMRVSTALSDTPLGHRERVEYRGGTTPGIGESVPLEALPQAEGFSTYNSHISGINTYHWDAHTLARHGRDYTLAHITHWLVTDKDNHRTSGEVASLKPPLE
ncbi:MAG: hypothetical protein LBP86_05390, partial [Azoarcus sp.]|nr:hypothetical protein [Azoarcus sp.]